MYAMRSANRSIQGDGYLICSSDNNRITNCVYTRVHKTFHYRVMVS